MNIKINQGPTKGVAIIKSVIEGLLTNSEQPGLWQEIGGNQKIPGDQNELNVADPIPCYTLEFEDIRNLYNPYLVKVGWRYLFFSEDYDLLFTADLDDQEASGVPINEDSFQSITRGLSVDLLNLALDFVDINYAGSNKDYELSIITAPSQNSAALRLLGKNESIYINYLNERTLTGDLDLIVNKDYFGFR